MARHEVVYAGRLMAKLRCDNCGVTTRLDVSHEYLPDLKERVTSKPGRLWQRVQNDPGELARSLPSRTLSKPKRVWDEVKAAWESRRS